MNRILLSLNHMGGKEIDFITKAYNDNWVVPLGPDVDAFERDLEQFVGENKRVVALSCGTAAIHLALVQLGVGKGDEVICQSFTFAASANPIVYQGATPVFVDSETESWNIDPDLMEEAIIDRKNKTGKYPKAIIAVHLYGMPARIDRICEIAQKYNIPVVEDAAEALGSFYKGKACGTYGTYGTLSFNGNKIITTSGGGALICNDAEAVKSTMFYATQAREARPYYYHEHIGYNYRLSNISAAIGRGQMLVLQEHIDRRRAIHQMYTDAFKDIKGVSIKQNPDSCTESNFWLSCLMIDNSIIKTTPDEIRIALAADNIETRLLWYPMHNQPIFADAPFYSNGVSDSIFSQGLCIPSGSILTDEEIQRVIARIKMIIK